MRHNKIYVAVCTVISALAFTTVRFLYYYSRHIEVLLQEDATAYGGSMRRYQFGKFAEKYLAYYQFTTRDLLLLTLLFIAISGALLLLRKISPIAYCTGAVLWFAVPAATTAAMAAFYGRAGSGDNYWALWVILRQPIVYLPLAAFLLLWVLTEGIQRRKRHAG